MAKVRYCANCKLEAKDYFTSCPQCGSEAFEWQGSEFKYVGPEQVQSYIEGQMRKADGYAKTSVPCFCGRLPAHYMIMPGERSEQNYTKLNPLFAFPRCPAEVWWYNREKAFSNTKNISEFLEVLKIKDG